MAIRQILLPLVLTLLLAACKPQAEKRVIGVSQCSEDIWRDKMNDELRTAALIDGTIDVRLESANDDDRRQCEQINRMIDEGIDLLIVSPNQLKTVAPAIDRAYDSGIPVILYDRKTDSDKYTAFMGCDNYLIGHAMGHHIAQATGGRARIVEIGGLAGSSPAMERHRGLLDAMADYPQMTLVASQSGDWKEESGERAMDEVLRQTSDFDYVFAHNDRMAMGARRAAEKHGLRGRYRYTGVDGLATKGGGLELVRDSLLDATCIYPTKGADVAQLAIRILNHQTYERDNALQTSIVTAETAELSLLQAKDAEAERESLRLLHSQVDSYIAQYQSQKTIAIILATGILLLIVLIVTIYRSLVVKARLNSQLAETNRRLTETNEQLTCANTTVREQHDEIVELSGEIEALTRARDREFLQHLHTIIASHLSDSDFNVEAIGQEMSLSRVQLYRKVKTLTGLTVVELLKKERLAEGKRLLEQTGKTVSEIAYDTGFSSPSYFSKCFREAFGSTPGEWQEKSTKNSKPEE